MCDVCEDDDKWTTPPGTPERRAEVAAAMEDRILSQGHQVMCIFPVDDDEGHYFWYTVGRSLMGQPELLLTGPLPNNVAGHIVNEAVRMVDEEGFDLKDGAEFPPNTLLNGFSMRVIECDPRAGEMFAALDMGGDTMRAFQLIWPDDAGHFPDDPAFDTRFNQPLFPKES